MLESQIILLLYISIPPSPVIENLQLMHKQKFTIEVCICTHCLESNRINFYNPQTYFSTSKQSNNLYLGRFSRSVYSILVSYHMFI